MTGLKKILPGNTEWRNLRKFYLSKRSVFSGGFNSKLSENKEKIKKEDRDRRGILLDLKILLESIRLIISKLDHAIEMLEELVSTSRRDVEEGKRAKLKD